MWKQGRTICSITRCLTDNLPAMYDCTSNSSINLQQTRHIRKHWNPKFKRLRRDKVYPISDEHIMFYQTRFTDEVTPEQQRARLLRMNIPLNHHTPPINIHTSSSNSIVNAYKPAGGDGEYSIRQKMDKKFSDLKMWPQDLIALRNIRSRDIHFNKHKFPEDALEIYRKAHELLTSDNKEDLVKYVTPNVYAVMMHNAGKKTIRWKLLKVLEPPKMVQARLGKLHDNLVYAQITVRLHTEQQLAIYDRFGRLMQGSEILRKDVLEYVVFEKVLTERNSTWRIIGKIQGKVGKSTEAIEKTYVQKSVKIDGNFEESSTSA